MISFSFFSLLFLQWVLFLLISFFVSLVSFFFSSVVCAVSSFNSLTLFARLLSSLPISSYLLILMCSLHLSLVFHYVLYSLVISKYPVKSLSIPSITLTLSFRRSSNSFTSFAKFLILYLHLLILFVFIILLSYSQLQVVVLHFSLISDECQVLLLT